MLKGNKGEWSEIYTFLKLIAEGKLYAADSDLNRIENIFYPILKILRNESSGSFEYHTNCKIKVIEAGSNKTLLEIPVENFKHEALVLLEQIRNNKGSSFSVPEIEEFMNSIKCTSLKAPSTDKSDIRIMVHDLNTGFNPVLGFSIKSKLGRPSTLFNASKATNFIYCVKGDNSINEERAKYINTIESQSKIRDRIKLLKSNNCKLEFSGMDNQIFLNNLQVIDSSLPNIISRMLLIYYEGHADLVKDLARIVTDINPCGYNMNHQHPFYIYKIKKFLSEIALGMKPANVWIGKADATGGYIIVREDGEVLCYHIYNRNEFEEYLLNNTKFDTPSSSRHDFGYVYNSGWDKYIKLNLQIRFI